MVTNPPGEPVPNTHAHKYAPVLWVVSSLAGTAVFYGWYLHRFPAWILAAAVCWAATIGVWAALRAEADNHNNTP